MDLQQVGGGGMVVRMIPRGVDDNRIIISNGMLRRMIPRDNDDNRMMINNQFQTISKKFSEIQSLFKEIGDGCNNWVSKQSPPVEDAIYIASNAIKGAAQGALVGAVSQVASHVFPQQSLALKGFIRSPTAEARTFGAVQGTFASLVCIFKRIRGKDDVQTRMAAGFGAGAMWNSEGRMGKPYGVADSAILGVACALFGGGMFQLEQKFSQPSVEYTRTRCMLSKLGLQNYEKNFKKGLLTDITLPLLTDSALKDVGVPPGPRLLILDHIGRDSGILNCNRCGKDALGETDRKLSS